MPRRKNTKPESIDEVIDHISAAEDEIKNTFIDNNSNEKSENIEPQNDNTDLENKRDELLKLVEDGDLDKSVAYIKKVSNKVLNKLYTEYERKRMPKANEFRSDLLISKFANTLGGLEAIESPD